MDYTSFVSGFSDPDSGVASVFIENGAGIKAVAEEDGVTFAGSYESLKAVWSALDAIYASDAD